MQVARRSDLLPRFRMLKRNSNCRALRIHLLGPDCYDGAFTWKAAPA